MDNILYRVSIHPKQPTADTITFYAKIAILPTVSEWAVGKGAVGKIYLPEKWKYYPSDIIFDDSTEGSSPLIKILDEFKPFRFDMTINLLHRDYRAISCYELYDCYPDKISRSSLDYTQSGTEITMGVRYNRYKFFELV